MAGSHLCPELRALLTSPAPLFPTTDPFLAASYGRKYIQICFVACFSLRRWELKSKVNLNTNVNYNLVRCHRLLLVLSRRALLDYYPLGALFNPTDVKDRAQVEARHFVRAAGSVNFDSCANSPDWHTGYSRSGVCPSQVLCFFCRDRDVYDSSDAGYCLSLQCPKPRSWWIETEKETGDEDVRKRRHECAGDGFVIVDHLWLRQLRAQ